MNATTLKKLRETLVEVAKSIEKSESMHLKRRQNKQQLYYTKKADKLAWRKKIEESVKVIDQSLIDSIK